MSKDSETLSGDPALALRPIPFSVIQKKINGMYNKEAQEKAQTLLDTAKEEKQQIDQYFQETQLQEFYKDIIVCIDTINTAKAALSACRPPGRKDQVKITYILEQMSVFQDLKLEILSREKAKEMPAGWSWRGQGLRVDQQRIQRDIEFYRNFQATLASIGDLAKQQRQEKVLPSVFLSYAWPTEKNKQSERWIQPFLVELQKVLQQVGFTVVLDIRNVAIGGDAHAYMQKVRDYDYTLLLCTPSLKEKCNDPKFHAIKIEMAKMILKGNEDVALYGSAQILPIALEGVNGENYPDWFNLNKIVFDFRHRSYVNNIRILLGNILSLDLSSKAFTERWTPVKASRYIERVTEQEYKAYNEVMKKKPRSTQ